MRAALYARVSLQEQAEGYSIEAQLEAMRSHCELAGWDVVVEHIDPGLSGTTSNRPGLRQALADCKAGKVDVLLTHRLDRLYRNLRLQLETMEQLEEWGIIYISVSENLDFGTPHGRLTASIMGSINEYYVRNLSRETEKGKRQRAKRGLSNASIPAYGYRRVERLDIVEPEEAAVVRSLFARYATGQYTDPDLARWLTQEDAPLPQQAIRWARYTVRSVLTNPFYIGMVRHGDDLYPGQHEPIIDVKVFEQAQAVRAERILKKTRIYSPSGHVYLLSGVLYCSHCGTILWALRKEWGGSVRYYYRCPARDKGKECDVSTYVRVEVLDEQVAALIRKVRLPDDWRDRLVELVNHEEERDRIEARRKQLEQALHRFQQLYGWGDIARNQYERERARIQAELDSLRVPDRPAVEEAAKLLESLGEVWDDAPREVQRGIVQTLFQEIHADIPGGRVASVRLHPDFWQLFEMMEVTNGIEIKAG